MDFGAEIDPREVGVNPDKLKALHALLEKQIADGWEPGLQLTVRRKGQIVFNVAMGLARRDEAMPMTTHTLMMIFSATKPLTAICIHLLAERGQLELDAPVARYWPEFANNGKEAVTVRHVLTHRGGFPGVLGATSRFSTWADVVRLMEEATLRFPPGEVVAYHPLNYGWVLGEVVARVSGQPIAQFMHDEIFAPLKMHHSFLGLPESEDYRSSRFHGLDAEMEKGMRFWNSERARRLPMPAANAWITSADMSRFYQMMLNKGELDGVRIVQPETVAQATAVSALDEFDQTLQVKTRWAHGFHLGGGTISSFGKNSTVETFGHNGYQSTTAWADPSRQLVSVFFTNQVIGPEKSFQRDLLTNEAVMDICE